MTAVRPFFRNLYSRADFAAFAAWLPFDFAQDEKSSPDKTW
jgi:hypothetical protein